MSEIDRDPIETQEWLDSLESVIKYNGQERAAHLIDVLTEAAADKGVSVPAAITTPYKNTIAPSDERPMPGDLFMERSIRSYIRWNVMAMVCVPTQTTKVWVVIFPVLLLVRHSTI